MPAWRACCCTRASCRSTFHCSQPWNRISRSCSARKLPYGVAGGIAILLGPVGPDPEIGILRRAGVRRARSKWHTGAADRLRSRSSLRSRRPADWLRRSDRARGASARPPVRIRRSAQRAGAPFRRSVSLSSKRSRMRSKPRHAFDIEIQEVAVENAVRQIGAGVERPAVVDRVQRIERDEIDVQQRARPSRSDRADRGNRRSPSCARERRP